MRRPLRLRARPALIILLLNCWFMLPAAGAQSPSEELAPYLRKAWHDVEVIIFERTGIGDVHAGEQLMVAAPRQWSNRLTMLAGGDWLTHPFPLDEETRRQTSAFVAGSGRGLQTNQATQSATGKAEPPEPPTAGKQPVVSTDPQLPSSPPTPGELFQSALKAWEDEVEASTYLTSAASDRTLNTAAMRLVSQGGTRILWHQRWSQELSQPGRGASVLVQGGALLIDRFQLEGSLDVSRSDVINVTAKLWLNGPHVGREPILLAAGPEAGTVTGSEAGKLVPLSMDRYLALEEERSISPGELHYLDHPRFGVLIMVRPVMPPESVLLAFEAFRAVGNQTRN